MLSILVATPSKPSKIEVISSFNYESDETVSALRNMYKNSELNIAAFAIENYVKEIESLRYNMSEDPDYILIKKMEKLNNIFTPEMFRTYSDFTNKDLNTEIEYLKKGIQKTCNINNIIFYTSRNIDVTKSILFKILNIAKVSHAVVHFSIYDEITEEESSYQAILRYSITIPAQKNDPVEVKISEYKKIPTE